MDICAWMTLSLFVAVLGPATGATTVDASGAPLNTTTPTTPAAPAKHGASDFAGYVIEPIMFTTGLVGNSLTVVVMRSPKFKELTASRILTALAMSDMTVSVMHPFNRPITRELLGLDARSQNGDSGCKVFFWAWRTAKMTSSWFIVMVTVERFIAVWIPLKVKMICTKRNTYLGILAIYVGIGSVTGVWTFASGINKKGKCVPDLKPPGYETYTQGFLYAGTLLYSIIPTIIMLLLSPMICWRLFKQMRRRQGLASSDSKDTQTARTSAMLMGVTCAYVVLVNPHAIMHNVAFMSGKDFFEDPSIKVAREVAQVLEQINYSINFFLYILSSSQFRSYLRKLCFRHGPCKRLGVSGESKGLSRSTHISATTD